MALFMAIHVAVWRHQAVTEFSGSNYSLHVDRWEMWDNHSRRGDNWSDTENSCFWFQFSLFLALLYSAGESV